MFKIESEKLKQDLIMGLNFLKKNNKKYLFVEIENITIDNLEELIDYITGLKISGQNYTEEEINTSNWDYDFEEIEEFIIKKSDTITILLDQAESTIQCTIDKFIDLIEDVRFSNIDDGIYISNKKTIIRVEARDIENPFWKAPNYEKIVYYKNSNIEVGIYEDNDFYSLKVFLDNDFSEYTPVILYYDFFIKIKFDDKFKLNKDEILELCNAVIYDFFLKYKISLEISPRKTIYEHEYEEESTEFNDDDSKLEFNAKLLSKGMKDVLNIFNNAESLDLNRAIVEYVKVIEYISPTVSTKILINKVYCRLKCTDNLNPTAEYIKELEELFCRHSKNTKSDSDLIKNTIKECCKIEELKDYFPTYIRKIYKGNYTNIDNVKNDLAKSISDTRNEISHAKANYTKKGLECPNEEKQQFIILLKNICIQIIEWFYDSEENIRVLKK
ncbi:hypothetical protein [Clostridium frigidicarnis]|uniref:ApeA N-terminal domain-containing protein n=1 Tax=Clostridium frigidicarnis TaxID=84698 RepID=A0A1I1AKE9_9CLOT|nr:hypothetical protein [Clostridium frigidicarnis]SFB38407.1 hypothetical protein SAMN04488528_10395 [Clostridium frigidicarnis]